MKPVLHILPVLAALYSVTSCGGTGEENSPPEPEKVRVFRVAAEEARPAIETFGTIIHRNKADVYPNTEGTVALLEAEEGDWVEKDRLLAVISNERLVLSRDRALSDRESKRSLLALAEQKLVEGRKSVEARLLSVEKARAELEQRTVEFQAFSRILENKKRLFDAGGISGGELEAVRTSHSKSGTDLAQSERDLAILSIGFRDSDIIEAGFPVPPDCEDRRRLLLDLGTLTFQAERDVAAAELEAAVSELKRIDLQLEDTRVRAPIEGVVAKRGVELGEKAGPDKLMFSILYTGSVFALAEVTERDLVRLGVGDDASVRPENLPPQEGKVSLISPFLNPQSKSARVRVLVDNSPGLLVPGMFVRITIFTGPAGAVLRIPESALLEEEGGTAVFALRDSTIFRIPVEIGSRTDGKAVIVRGLSEGEKIVEKPSRILREGTRAEAVE